MGNVLESNTNKSRAPRTDGPTDAGEWETVVPYLPRVRTFKRRRSNSLPVKAKTPMRIVPLSDANSRQRLWRRSDYFYPEMIPEPDYSDEEDPEGAENTATANSEKEEDQEVEEIIAKHDTKRKPMSPLNDSMPRRSRQHPNKSDDGLVVPKKPPNPYMESADHKKLCKEIKFNQKYGSFNTKSELQIALERYQDDKLRKNMAASRKNSLEMILEQQAKKIEKQEKESCPRRPGWMDRLQEQQDSWIPDSRTEEFFQVHARVMSQQSSGSSSLNRSETGCSVSNASEQQSSTACVSKSGISVKAKDPDGNRT